MPLYREDLANRLPRTLITGSVAVEIEWALATVQRSDFKRDHPVLERVYSQHPELVERARSFWGPGQLPGDGGSIELIVLAHHGGLLACVDPEEFLGRLEALCANAPVELRLASEARDDRKAVLARLERLRTSAPDRRSYVELVTELWSVLAPAWETEGRAAVESAVAARQDLARKAASWRDVAVGHVTCDPQVASDLVSQLGPEGTVMIVPAYFAHLGSLIDLPGAVMLGVRSDDLGPQSRARTEFLARQLKSIADPTRLALLEAVRTSPSTVTDLAARFGLAQPTVSNHVKVLREAGIVSQRTDAGRRVLTMQPDVLTDLIKELQDVLALSNGANHLAPLALA